MTISEIEAVASLKILAAVARADGSVNHDERRSLVAALDVLVLEKPLKIDDLLSTDDGVDVSAELSKLHVARGPRAGLP